MTSSNASPAQPSWSSQPGGWPAPASAAYGSPAQPTYPEHPQGTTVLVLGILALSLFVTGPFAWYRGAKAMKEIAASGQHYGNERDIEIGRLLGMIATFVWGGIILLYAIMLIAFVGFFASMLANFPR